MFNSTQNPFMMNSGSMYYGNFVDILFRYLMGKGMEGLTFMASLNFYIYLSLDRIKDLFKYINDKIGNYMNQFLEYIGTKINDKIQTITNYVFNRIQLFTSKTKIKESVPVTNNNKIYVKLNPENKSDLLALGYFLLKNREQFNFFDHVRESSDKYKAVIKYNVPPSIKLSNALDDDIDITMSQSINFSLVCEYENKIESLKDINFKIIDPEPILISQSSFETLITNVEFPNVICPSWRPSSISWCSAPDSFYNGFYMSILFYIYYTKNSSLFKIFYKFINHNEPFDFNGKKYKLNRPDSCATELNKDDIMKEFIKEWMTYCDKLIEANKNNTKVISWISNVAKMFEPVTIHTQVISICFESQKMTCHNLSQFSKYFMHNIIMDYYHQNNNVVDAKISIYRLFIKYEIKTSKKENPRYTEWEKKYGDTTSKDTTKDTTSKDTTAETKDTKTHIVYMFGDHNPLQPEKIIEEETKIAVADTEHIKTD